MGACATVPLVHTMRSGVGKTVMAPRDSSTRHGLADGDFSGIPGDRESLDALFSLTYEELRRLAATVRHGDPGVTLTTTALVNEAWLKLSESHQLAPTSRLHFKRIAARAMRQVLIEAARRRHAGKRGSGSPVVTFDEALQPAASSSADLLALDAALKELARINPRHAAMVESRFFGGLEAAEIAELLQVSEATVLRDWRVARAWLARALRQSP